MSLFPLEGGVISPLLCNIYLHELDVALSRERLQAVRYADDFVVMCRTGQERDDAFEKVSSTLTSIRLEINTDRTRLTSFEEGSTFLGVSLFDAVLT